MPFTFSHPAAILPFANSKNRLSQTGLVIGSIVPDLEFYLKLKLGENIGHKLLGIFVFDLPIAMLVALIFHCLIKYPLYKASPAWIQSRTVNSLDFNWLLSLKMKLGWILISMMLGVFTHLTLDGMTHYDGWLVYLLPILSNEITIAGFSMPVFDFLQYALSLLGLYFVVHYLLTLESTPVSGVNDFKKVRFWVVALTGSGLAVLFRASIFPEFISFWDVFMMCVGGVIYGIFFASLVENLVGERRLNSDRKLDKLIHSRSADPRFKRRSLFVKENKFFGLFGKAVMHVNNLIDKSEIIDSQSTNVQIDKINISSEDFGQFTSKNFSGAALRFPDNFHFEGRFIFASYQKITDMYFHGLMSLKKYIKTTFKLMGFSGLIFIPFVVNGQVEGLDLALREQFIQKASELRSAENYVGAISQLDSILIHNAMDAQILLFKGDLCLQNQDFGQAVAVFNQLIPLEYESTIVKINLSYALFMSKKPSRALEAAFSAWNQDQKNKGAVVNYFNAMLWNIKTKDAESYLLEHLDLVDADQALVMKARLYTTAGNYSKGLAYYDTLVLNFPKSYYIQEYSEVLIGKKQFKKAEALVSTYESELSPSQKQKLHGLLEANAVQTVGGIVGYFADVAKNTRTEQSVFWQNQRNAPVQIGVRTGANQVKAPEGQVTKSRFLAAGASSSWSQAWYSSAEVILQEISPDSKESFTAVTGKFETKYQPNDRRMYGVTYSSDILNFTADLLGKNIRSQNAGYLTHIMLGGKTGFYSQGSVGMLNDQNTSLQFFGSVYRVLRTEPTLKTGFNFSALSFSDSETTLYFAPNRFMSTEVFVDYSTPMPLVSRMALKFQGAGGFQQIENQSWDPSFRVQVELNYRVSGYDFGLKGQFSNVAAASGSGYQFQYITLKVSKSFK
jgi:tetratricopeptide (TPR) repeat protein